MIDGIAETIRSCTKCGLHKTRTQAVPGAGDDEGKVVFIGEAPGYWEDKEGIPFVGRAGKLLDEVLESFGITRDSVFITNIVKCRPPKNRRPEKGEIETCAPYLDRQLEAISPMVIATLGATAGEYVFIKYGFTWTGMLRENGQPKSLNTIFGRLTIVPVIHPAAVLRDMNKRPMLEEAVSRITELI